MKAWNLKVRSNPQEIGQKLDAVFGSAGGFVLKMDAGTNDSIRFNLRKRSLNYLNFIRENQTIVHGKALETDTPNETDLEISFTPHFLSIMYVSLFMCLGLLSIIVGISSNAILLYGSILFVIGMALWMDVRKRSERNIQKYKKLISDILVE